MSLIRFLMALAITLTPSFATAQGRATSVGVQEVRMQVLSETVPIFADVVTARDGSVASRVAGNVEKVHVLAGARVSEGDLLVELNKELLAILVQQSEAEVAEATAGIGIAQARLDSAEIVFERTEGLKDSASFSQGRFDDAQAAVLEAGSELAAAQAREKSSQARLAESRYTFARGEIRAPFSGVVIDVQTIPGAYIQAGTPVVRILDTDSLESEASVPGRYLTGLAPGQMVQATTSEGVELTAEVRAILPLEDPSTRTRPVRFSAAGLGDVPAIAAGESLTVQIPIGDARELLSVPKDALVQSPGGWTVFVVEDDKATPRPVTLGVAVGDRYEVVSGLAPGDLAVVRGNERLRPGQDVTAAVLETN